MGAQIHPDDQPNGVGPSQHPSLHCREDNFYLLQCLILTILAQYMLWQRLKRAILLMVVTVTLLAW